jgi:hypothetical protein
VPVSGEFTVEERAKIIIRSINLLFQLKFLSLSLNTSMLSYHCPSEEYSITIANLLSRKCSLKVDEMCMNKGDIKKRRARNVCVDIIRGETEKRLAVQRAQLSNGEVLLLLFLFMILNKTRSFIQPIGPWIQSRNVELISAENNALPPLAWLFYYFPSFFIAKCVSQWTKKAVNI